MGLEGQVRMKALKVIEDIKTLAELASGLSEAELQRIGESLQVEMDKAEEHFDKVFPGWRDR